jgi:hypothetical protein
MVVPSKQLSNSEEGQRRHRIREPRFSYEMEEMLGSVG